ncbi:helix-turn-helix domain-containing protein [Chryseobacterium sp. ES2]|uniref:Helix-turn-helix domain-containing protein n=1 Tax=Chryseobacterium metallicongregator TaxID=3073042 RepID=A0ABU1E767_9FLAO|nr:helix-turn-helix domain-containing protein [Chryseobacterium sp. ES2]MDR4953638.1 helix-turn-helix domain-containing protein [Chryseobacterium sp. ES2]
MNNLQPNYKLIYQDIIAKKYPDKKSKCDNILNKNELSVLDIIRLNNIIFGTVNNEPSTSNQRLRSYDKITILQILDYQKIHRLNNTEIAIKFNLSRNTVSKWKKIFFNKPVILDFGKCSISCEKNNK